MEASIPKRHRQNRFSQEFANRLTYPPFSPDTPVDQLPAGLMLSAISIDDPAYKPVSSIRLREVAKLQFDLTPEVSAAVEGFYSSVARLSEAVEKAKRNEGTPSADPVSEKDGWESGYLDFWYERSQAKKDAWDELQRQNEARERDQRRLQREKAKRRLRSSSREDDYDAHNNPNKRNQSYRGRNSRHVLDAREERTIQAPGVGASNVAYSNISEDDSDTSRSSRSSRSTSSSSTRSSRISKSPIPRKSRFSRKTSRSKSPQRLAGYQSTSRDRTSDSGRQRVEVKYDDHDRFHKQQRPDTGPWEQNAGLGSHARDRDRREAWRDAGYNGNPSRERGASGLEGRPYFEHAPQQPYDHSRPRHDEIGSHSNGTHLYSPAVGSNSRPTSAPHARREVDVCQNCGSTSHPTRQCAVSRRGGWSNQQQYY
ncbi:hypothetical protein DFS34DRAFT_455392 [Phlyctochytrium arcticum]|nr:hypothetical protein DFS34DRAFT_455392 [Phlyctochytrium arcticum]